MLLSFLRPISLFRDSSCSWRCHAILRNIEKGVCTDVLWKECLDESCIFSGIKSTIPVSRLCPDVAVGNYRRETFTVSGSWKNIVREWRMPLRNASGLKSLAETMSMDNTSLANTYRTCWNVKFLAIHALGPSVSSVKKTVQIGDCLLTKRECKYRTFLCFSPWPETVWEPSLWSEVLKDGE